MCSICYYLAVLISSNYFALTYSASWAPLSNLIMIVIFSWFLLTIFITILVLQFMSYSRRIKNAPQSLNVESLRRKRKVIKFIGWALLAILLIQAVQYFLKYR